MLESYLNEETKLVNRTPDASRPPGGDARQKMVPGTDYAPLTKGIWLFGKVASEASRRGLPVAAAQTQEVVAVVSDWWVHDRQESAIKAHHFVGSFDNRIAQELQARRFPVDAMLLGSVHQTISQFGARFYPGETLGWVAGCHHDRAHAHVHVLVHPQTANGTLLRMSGLKAGEAGEDKFDFLRNTFNTRSRQLFVGLTQQSSVSPEKVRLGARHHMLLAHHAFKSFPDKPADALTNATRRVADWITGRDYATNLGAAVKSATEESIATVPQTRNPADTRAFWTHFHEGFERRRGAHLDTALASLSVITRRRANGPDYSPIRGSRTIPHPPTTGEYLRLAGLAEEGADGSVDRALVARREASEKRRLEANKALLEYQSAIEKGRRDLDEMQVRAAADVAQTALEVSAVFGIQNRLAAEAIRPGIDVERALPSDDRTIDLAERELTSISNVEARAHAPADPSAIPGLLAMDHSPRFRELVTPNVNIPAPALVF